jgi:acyl-CoA thioester hydrolase
MPYRMGRGEAGSTERELLAVHLLGSLLIAFAPASIGGDTRRNGDRIMLDNPPYTAARTPEFGAIIYVDVFFDDLDWLGMLHNGRFGILVERAWSIYWRQQNVAVASDWTLKEDGFILTKQFSITYESPVSRPGRYAVHLWVERLGTSSMTYGFELQSLDGETVFAHGNRIVVNLDPEAKVPTPWSESARSVALKLKQ